MNSQKKESHWESLAADLGADKPTDAASLNEAPSNDAPSEDAPSNDVPSNEEAAPADELPLAFGAVASSTQMPVQKPAAWNDLAESLGLDVSLPPPPAPEEPGAAERTDAADTGGPAASDRASLSPTDEVAGSSAGEPDEVVAERHVPSDETDDSDKPDDSDKGSNAGTERQSRREPRRGRRRRRRGRSAPIEESETSEFEVFSGDLDNLESEVEFAAAEDDDDAALNEAKTTGDMESDGGERLEEAKLPAAGDEDAGTEKEGDEGRRPKRRRRRGRRGGRRTSTSEQTEGGGPDSALDDSAPDDSALDDSALDDSALDDSALDDSALDEIAAGDLAATDHDGDQVDDESAAASKRRPSHRNIPTWEESVGVIVAANLDARAKTPKTSPGGRGRGRGRGGRSRTRGPRKGDNRK